MDVPFKAIPSNFDEKLDDTRSPVAVAEELGLGKALDVAERFPEAIVIGSDTIVYVDGRQLEKPLDDDDARATLRHLSGKQNTVVSSVAVVCKAAGIQLVGSQQTQVVFKPQDDAAIERYLASGDHRDKAGSYGIQSGAHELIEGYIGSYPNIIGLPTEPLADFLAQLGIATKPVHLEAPVPHIGTAR